MKIKFINNWIYKAHWYNLFEYIYSVDTLRNKHLLIGIFGFFLFITWR